MMPRLVCMTSDKYLDALKPFIWLLRRYWDDVENLNVLVAGFTKPDFSLNNDPYTAHRIGVEFHSIGKFEDYPIGKWSDSLIDLLDQIDDDYIILMLEDYWMIRHVNVQAVRYAHQYMSLHPGVLKFDLAADRFFAGGAQRDFEHYYWLDIVKSDAESAYHMSLMTGMWNTKLLKQVLKHGWSPWDVEIKGTTHLKNFPQFDVVGSGQWPIKHTLAFRSGDSSKLLLNEVHQEDVYAMKQLGLLNRWEV